MVQFYPWFKFYFRLSQTYYHTPKQKKINLFKPRMKLNLSLYIYNGPKYCRSEVTAVNIMAATKTAM